MSKRVSSVHKSIVHTDIENIPVIPGFFFAGVAAGIKKTGALDLGLIAHVDAKGQRQPTRSFAAIFTQNKVRAAPVKIAERNAKSKSVTAVLVNSEGQRDGAVWGRRARWIDTLGTVDGQAVGLAMFDHPANHAHPTWWHARTYGLLAANPFGVHDFEKRPKGTGTLTVPVGGALCLRYRVLLHGAGWDTERLDAAWRAFAAN